LFPGHGQVGIGLQVGLLPYGCLLARMAFKLLVRPDTSENKRNH